MDTWIEFAKGPLFAITFLIMLLGLLRLVIIQMYTLLVHKGRRLRNAPWRDIIKETVTWAVPFKHFIRGTRVFSTVSFLFHIGILIVPIFLAAHIVLWEEFLGVNLPAIGQDLADWLTLGTIGCLIVLVGHRMFIRRIRAMSRPIDYILLIMVLLPFASGYLAAHPSANPLPWNAMFLIHLLSAEVLFVLIPFTKLAHIVLYFFDRISAVHWQLRPGAGDKVAEALFGKEARV